MSMNQDFSCLRNEFDYEVTELNKTHVLKNAESSPSKLKKLLDDGQAGEFFKEAKPSDEDRKNIPWIFYFIANTPLLSMDSLENARWVAGHNDVDFLLKENVLQKLSTERYRDLFRDHQASSELMASYGASVMRDFLNQLQSKSYSDRPVFVSKEESNENLKRSSEIMGPLFLKLVK